MNFIWLLIISLSVFARSETREGEIHKQGSDFVFIDKQTKEAFYLSQFPPKEKAFQPVSDFYYLKLKGEKEEKSLCRRNLNCFRVTGYEFTMYDPLKDDPALSQAIEQMTKKKNNSKLRGVLGN